MIHLKKYQNSLKLVEGGEFVDYIYFMCHKCHRISPSHGGSYIDSLDSIRKQQ